MCAVWRQGKCSRGWCGRDKRWLQGFKCKEVRPPRAAHVARVAGVSPGWSYLGRAACIPAGYYECRDWLSIRYTGGATDRHTVMPRNNSR